MFLQTSPILVRMWMFNQNYDVRMVLTQIRTWIYKVFFFLHLVVSISINPVLQLWYMCKSSLIPISIVYVDTMHLALVYQHHFVPPYSSKDQARHVWCKFQTYPQLQLCACMNCLWNTLIVGLVRFNCTINSPTIVSMVGFNQHPTWKF